MDTLCYDLAIRQRRCQNGISVTTDNVYTDIKNGAKVILSYGYTLTIISKNSNSVTVELNNSELLNNIKFNIQEGTYKTFDLPMFNGSFILLIGVVKKDCKCPNIG